MARETARVQFAVDGLTYSDYPFPPSAAHGGRLIPWATVRDADPASFPPEIRLHTGETLVVNALQRDELATELALRGVRIVARPDVWGWLLEPYLDTEFSPSDQARTLEHLTAAGIARGEVDRIRREVGGFVLAYNALQWEWIHLGLSDLLFARMSPWTRLTRGLRGERFSDFYWWAMALADRPTTGTRMGE